MSAEQPELRPKRRCVMEAEASRHARVDEDSESDEPAESAESAQSYESKSSFAYFFLG
jgi:hypothetical protein